MALRSLVDYTGDGAHLTSQEVANVTNQLEGLASYAVDDVQVICTRTFQTSIDSICKIQHLCKSCTISLLFLY